MLERGEQAERASAEEADEALVPPLLALPRTVQTAIFQLLDLSAMHALACVCSQLAEASACEYLWSALFPRLWSTPMAGLSQPQLHQFNRHHFTALRRFCGMQHAHGPRDLLQRARGVFEVVASAPVGTRREHATFHTLVRHGAMAALVWLVSRCAHALAELPAQAWRGSPEAPLDAAGGAWQACVFGALDLLALLLCRTPHATLRALQAEAEGAELVCGEGESGARGRPAAAPRSSPLDERGWLQRELDRLLALGLDLTRAGCDAHHFVALREVTAATAGVKALWGMADRPELPSVADMPPHSAVWGGWPRGGRPPYSRPYDAYLSDASASASAADHDFTGLTGAWRGHRLQPHDTDPELDVGVRIGWSVDKGGLLSGIGVDSLGAFNLHGRVYRSRTTHAATLLLRGVYREFGGLDPALVGQAHRAAFRFHGRLTPYGFVGYTGFESEGSVGEDALPRAHRCDEVWVLFPNHPARKRSVEPGVAPEVQRA